jgi:hypothetical protein
MQKNGISALQLHRDLGMSYPTSWSMYHGIREMMSDGRTDLTGIVEMDETHIGGKPLKYQRAKYGEPLPNEYLDKKLKKLSPSFDFSNDSVKKMLLAKMPQEVVVQVKRLSLEF